MEVAGFLQAAAAAAFLAKLVVDGIKIAVDLPRWGPVLFAFLAAQGAEFGLLTSQGATLTAATISSAIIIGFVAWGLAIGVTMAQNKGDKVDEKIQAALDQPAGTTRAQLDKVVEKQN